MVKNLPAYAADVGLIPGLGRSAGEGNGNSLQHSFLENPMDRRAWWATVHGVAKNRTCLRTEHSTAHTSVKKKKKKRPLLQIQSHSGVPGVRTSTYEFGGGERKVTF